MSHSSVVRSQDEFHVARAHPRFAWPSIVRGCSAIGKGGHSVIGRAMFSVSENGVLVMRSGGINNNAQIIWFDRAGKQLGPITAPGGYNMPALSPDEKTVAVSRVDLLAGTAADIWLIDLERGTQIRLTDDPASDSYPAWSPTSDRITFVSTRTGQTSIYVKSSNGSAVEEPLVSSAELKWNPTFSPDGKFIIYAQLNPKTNTDLYLVSTGSDKKVEPFGKLISSRLSLAFHRTVDGSRTYRTRPDSLKFTSKHFRLPAVSCWSRSAVGPNRNGAQMVGSFITMDRTEN